MFYFAGAPLKLDESAVGETERDLICLENARGLLRSANRKDLLP
jgi:hypothetical protein